MKKAVKVLMSTLFMLSALVMATSCQQDDMSEVDAKDLVIAAGTYDLKMVGTGSMSQGTLPITITSTQTATAEVKGTEPESKVIMSDSVRKMETTVTCPDATTYEAAKTEAQGQKGYTFDDSKLTITQTETEEADEDITMTYKNFLSSFVDVASEDVKDKVIYQNKDGSKIKVEATVKEYEIEGKVTITLTRK